MHINFWIWYEWPWRFVHIKYWLYYRSEGEFRLLGICIIKDSDPQP
jgi:hypothetical protein